MEKEGYQRVYLEKGQSFIFVNKENYITFICSYREDMKLAVEICYSGFNLFINERYVGAIKGVQMNVIEESSQNPTIIYFRKELK